MNYAWASPGGREAYARALKEKPEFYAPPSTSDAWHRHEEVRAPIEVLSVGAEKNPQSPDANRLLGEAYLQARKGSKAVPYLNEAARLGRADAHLRLAMLYNNAGRKDLAAAEYEQFLTKEPKHADKEKLRRYIEEIKSISSTAAAPTRRRTSGGIPCSTRVFIVHQIHARDAFVARALRTGRRQIAALPDWECRRREAELHAPHIICRAGNGR